MRWGSYGGYEGPAIYGGARFKLPAKPTEADRILAVITATEGGSWGAINMYDRCILTAGLIQWCEAGQYSVSDMLGRIHFRNPILLAPLSEMLGRSRAELKRDNRSRFRFFVDGDQVDTRDEQRQLFLLDSSGRIGDWPDESKIHAEGWARAVADTLNQPGAIEAQKDYTVSRLGAWFTMPNVRPLVDGAPDTALGRAFRAAFLSFAANNNLHAARGLQAADAASKEKRYSTFWLVEVLEQLVFRSGISIYPGRYDKIRPVLERLYSIDLPDLASHLRPGEWLTPEEIQSILLDLGHELGATGIAENGVDGVWGGKSRLALRDFQRSVGLPMNGDPDLATNDALKRARDRAAEAKGTRAGVLPPELRAHVQALVALSIDATIRETLNSST